MSKQKITFESEGLKVVGNLFRPQNAEKTSLPAVLVTGAMTGVKEQVAGSYVLEPNTGMRQLMCILEHV